LRILIADDEKNICRLLGDEFALGGFEADIAHDGAEAMRMIAQQPYDVIALDVSMPARTGIEILRDLSEKKGRAVVIMMTAYGSIPDAVACMKLKADDYITKPFEPAELVRRAKRLLTARDRLGESGAPVPESDALIGCDESMQRVRSVIRKVKDLNSTVLITGESGTGKGVVARMLHTGSVRADRPFVHVDCASLPETLIESELFGAEKGAYTGAAATRPGKFELVGEGTIFLDEISTLPPALQTRLLVVLQDRTFERLGGTRRIRMRGRVVAATNDDLEKKVAEGAFRADLLYRLNIINIEMPPLRRRRQDIAALSGAFLREISDRTGMKADRVDREVLEALQRYDWPGNVRELQNVLESAVVLSEDGHVTLSELPGRVRNSLGKADRQDVRPIGLSLEAQEIRAIVAALEKNGGHRERTAGDLGISRRALQYKLVKYKLG